MTKKVIIIYKKLCVVISGCRGMSDAFLLISKQYIRYGVTNEWYSCNNNKNSILRLQRIQNQAARILTKTPRRDHITEVLIDLHWLRIEERIVYKLLILTFKAFIDRTAPLYLCELIEQQKSSTNIRTRLANDPFLLKLPPPSRNCSDTFLIAPSLMEPHVNGTSLMNMSDGCPTLTCLSLKLRRCYFYVISTVSMTLVIIIRN